MSPTFNPYLPLAEIQYMNELERGIYGVKTYRKRIQKYTGSRLKTLCNIVMNTGSAFDSSIGRYILNERSWINRIPDIIPLMHYQSLICLNILEEESWKPYLVPNENIVLYVLSLAKNVLRVYETLSPYFSRYNKIIRKKAILYDDYGTTRVSFKEIYDQLQELTNEYKRILEYRYLVTKSSLDNPLPFFNKLHRQFVTGPGDDLFRCYRIEHGILELELMINLASLLELKQIHRMHPMYRSLSTKDLIVGLKDHSEKFRSFLKSIDGMELITDDITFAKGEDFIEHSFNNHMMEIEFLRDINAYVDDYVPPFVYLSF